MSQGERRRNERVKLGVMRGHRQKWAWSNITCGFLNLGVDPDGDDQQRKDLMNRGVKGQSHHSQCPFVLCFSHLLKTEQ